MMNDELQTTNREMPIAELRTPNRFSTTSTFEIHHSQFAPSSNQSGEGVARSASSKPEAKLHGRGRQRDTHRALIEADREMRNNEIRTTNRAFPTSTFELPPSKLAAPLPGRLFYCRPKVDRTDGFHRTQRHPTTAGPSIR